MIIHLTVMTEEAMHIKCDFQLPADVSRRVHRECLENGKWRLVENSSQPWRDDSECQEPHFFKDKVRNEALE